jgi:hypothetical protein
LERIPSLTEDLPLDPAISVSCAHGVLVCTLCGAAHKLLQKSTTTVRSLADRSSWTREEVHFLLTAGGNHQATIIQEAYWPPQQRHWPRPTAASTVADRLVFIRAKYEALAFCLPPMGGPRAAAAWQHIRRRHPEWEELWGEGGGIPEWGGDLVEGQDPFSMRGDSRYFTTNNDNVSFSNNSNNNNLSLSNGTTAMLPDRLIDYFCVVEASEYPMCAGYVSSTVNLHS